MQALAPHLLGLVTAVWLGAAAAAADRLDGTPVVKRIDVAALAQGREHRFYLRAGEDGTGDPHLVPVMIAKGVGGGPRLWLSAAVHGDELNGVRVVQRLFDELDPSTMRGTVIGLPVVNRPGTERHSRRLPMTAEGAGHSDLNRLMPGTGDQSDTHAGHRFARDLWEGVARGNVDLAIDLHTQTTGATYPLFVFADFREPTARRLATLLGPDMIKIDRGAAGSVETTFMERGIPAVTFEIGGPKVFDAPMVERALQGLRAVLVDRGVVDGPTPPTPSPAFIGNEQVTVRAVAGGFVEILVRLGEDLGEGQTVARQLDVFGDVILTYRTPADGRVLSIATDPVREPGALLVRLLRNNPEPGCRDGC
ncbi:MAG: succinylglutamate desuccinylase/aspartoacylase family protein [Pseudomonadota bacterium]